MIASATDAIRVDHRAPALAEYSEGWATYAFFVDDRRASRTVTNRGSLNGVTYYFYDGHEVIEERDGSGAVVQQYLFGPQHIDELLLTLGENGANWVHQDANWNVIGTTTSTGQVAERYTYDPYGRLRARRLTGFGDTDADGLVGIKDVEDWEDTQGEHGVYDRKLDANLDGVNDAYDAAAFDKMVSLPGGRLTVPNRRFSPSEQWAGYTARTLDPESGLMHYRARAYSPELRRFGQRDPIGYADGPALYAYTKGNPVRNVDPWGLETECARAGRLASYTVRVAQKKCARARTKKDEYQSCCASDPGEVNPFTASHFGLNRPPCSTGCADKHKAAVLADADCNAWLELAAIAVAEAALTCVPDATEAAKADDPLDQLEALKGIADTLIDLSREDPNAKTYPGLCG